MRIMPQPGWARIGNGLLLVSPVRRLCEGGRHDLEYKGKVTGTLIRTACFTAKNVANACCSVGLVHAPVRAGPGLRAA